MAVARMSRRGRKFFRLIKRARDRFSLQEIASNIQNSLARRHITYDEALTLGNFIHVRADALPGEDMMIYAVSDRDAYRKTLELYLKDGLLTKTEQLLLWEERRRLGIPQSDHDTLLSQLVNQMKKKGRSVTILGEIPQEGPE